MKSLSVDEVRAFLRESGVPSGKKIEEVLSGFDFTKAIYVQTFEPDDALFQYIRNSSASDPSPMAGEWFCLTGATKGGLAIMDGGSGRRLQRYKVARQFSAIEGTAKPMSVNWSWSGGGLGGSTQVFVPSPIVRASIVSVGPA